MALFNKNKAPLAQNDPRRVPKAHRELVVKIKETLAEQGYNFFDAQAITSLIGAAAKTSDPVKAMSTALTVTQMIADQKIEPMYTIAILELLAMQLNEKINATPLEDIKLESL